MHDQPPLPGASPDSPVGREELSELERKIRDLSTEIDGLLHQKAALHDRISVKALETMISGKLNERAGYIMRRQELLQGGAGEA